MSRFKDAVVCKFAGCNRVYNDPRILPCAHRLCAAHIEAIALQSDGIHSASDMIKCPFCAEMHTFPENGRGFPVDAIIPLILGMKHSREHSAAKKSFDELTQLLDTLTKFDGERYMNDYFDKVEADIVQEKEVNLQKLLAYYKEIVGILHERKVKCLHNLKTSASLKRELNAIKRTLAEHESKLKMQQLDFTLKTLDGDEDKWREIQSECDTLLETVRSLDDEFKRKIVADQMSPFKKSTICLSGDRRLLAIDSKIVNSDKMKSDLVELCNLGGKQFKLLYRGTRDGFQAKSFHAKCDHQPSTLTVFKSSKGFIFGGYTAVAWDSGEDYKTDPNAFIFSLVNPTGTPKLMQVAMETRAIYCHPEYGPTFGNDFDICIHDNSNKTSSSYSLLRGSYDASPYEYCSIEPKIFLTSESWFQTSELEVFYLN